VEVTSQRLERIMELGQGCRRRTPWWCWLLAALAAAVTWPGAAFVVTADDAKVLRAEPATEPAPSPVEYVPREPDEIPAEVMAKLKEVTTRVYEIEDVLSQLSAMDEEKKSLIDAFVRAHATGDETRAS